MPPVFTIHEPHIGIADGRIAHDGRPALLDVAPAAAERGRARERDAARDADSGRTQVSLRRIRTTATAAPNSKASTPTVSTPVGALRS